MQVTVDEGVLPAELASDMAKTTAGPTLPAGTAVVRVTVRATELKNLFVVLETGGGWSAAAADVLGTLVARGAVPLRLLAGVIVCHDQAEVLCQPTEDIVAVLPDELPGGAASDLAGALADFAEAKHTPCVVVIVATKTTALAASAFLRQIQCQGHVVAKVILPEQPQAEPSAAQAEAACWNELEELPVDDAELLALRLQQLLAAPENVYIMVRSPPGTPLSMLEPANVWEVSEDGCEARVNAFELPRGAVMTLLAGMPEPQQLVVSVCRDADENQSRGKPVWCHAVHPQLGQLFRFQRQQAAVQLLAAAQGANPTSVAAVGTPGSRSRDLAQQLLDSWPRDGDADVREYLKLLAGMPDLPDRSANTSEAHNQTRARVMKSVLVHRQLHHVNKRLPGVQGFKT